MDVAEIERELERLHPASFGWALACCGRRREDAEDVLQATYMKIIEGKARYGGRASLKTWLFAVIRRTAAEHRRRALVRALSLEKLLPFFTERVDSPVMERIECREQSSELLRALSGLATRQREVLELVFYHDMTVEEAALTLKISVGSARVHYARGKNHLSRILRRDE
jgi:RNA polymerase sigma-70 factor (ECF subfamily)